MDKESIQIKHSKYNLKPKTHTKLDQTDSPKLKWQTNPRNPN